jgi:lysozyme family protein
MAASNFRTSLSLVLAHEGGYVNHPKDPGGATNQGVTQKVYDAYRNYMHLPLQSVKLILDSEVSDIYNKQYWRTIKGDSLPCGIDYCVFDFGVNSGIYRAIKYLQRLCGFTGDDVDGVLGLVTLATVETKVAAMGEEVFIAQYCANRLAFLRSLKTFPTFGKGWTRRVVGYHAGIQESDNGVLDYATFMARREEASLAMMPRQLGETVKPIVADTAESYVEAPRVYTIDDVRKLALENDRLAEIIAGA